MFELFSLNSLKSANTMLQRHTEDLKQTLNLKKEERKREWYCVTSIIFIYHFFYFPIICKTKKSIKTIVSINPLRHYR